MPRKARRESRSRIYHIMMRGVDRQVIFRDDEDRSWFLTAVKQSKMTDHFKLHAFCLMSNHVHLLMEQAEEPLETIFKRIGVSYAIWYNRKYERVGHLFQDRFRSECVETEQYYRAVLRYIIRNPVKAGMVSQPGMYRWSSFLAYEKGSGSITDTQYALDLFGSRDSLLGFLDEAGNDAVMDEEVFDKRLRNELNKETMKRITQCDSASEFQKLDLSLQKEYARKLHQENMTPGQISVLTGMAKSTVYRAVKDFDSIQIPEEQTILLRETEALDFEEIW